MLVGIVLVILATGYSVLADETEYWLLHMVER
jgi:hypothetical protein